MDLPYIKRLIEPAIEAALQRGKSILLLGARQTGKTTLINQLSADFSKSLAKPNVRQRYEQDPSLLIGEVEAIAEDLKKMPLVVIDEVQKVPALLDAVQDLIDRRIAKFILTGSSARKLRQKSVNLLPGRIVSLRLDPLTLKEITFKQRPLDELLLYGTLPGIFNVNNNVDKETDLDSYVTTYLEEEIRAEAIVRNVGTFSKFLTLAASESGNIVNFSKLSQEIGIAHTTIASYYQILEDCLIAERVEPLIDTKTRRKLTKSSRFLFFDLGVRRISAGEGTKIPQEYLGRLFKQWIGLELIHYARLKDREIKIHFWRDVEGPKIDWIIKKNDQLIPIEVKWTEKPDAHHIKYLKLFMKENTMVDKAYVICRAPNKIKLEDRIYALPWQDIDSLINQL